MKKNDKRPKIQRHKIARAKYEAKRRNKAWKFRKRKRKNIIRQSKIRNIKQRAKPYERLPSPENFSLIDNTDEVLAYFKKAEKKLHSGENITFDISKITSLTPETVALLVASINDRDFTRDSIVEGNEPENSNLAKMFRESGFYDHVNARGSFVSGKGNLLHKEVNQKVRPAIAREACITGLEHVFGSKDSFEPLYEILIECMANTTDHADLQQKGKCRWWLYVHNKPNEKITSYTFLDLGVGIFKSLVFQKYIKNIAKGIGLYKNIDFADDLLKGKLQSRMDFDNRIRGKGIPQIVSHSESSYFKKFYIIANDVKINLKTKKSIQLENPLKGTFLYWELENNLTD